MSKQIELSQGKFAIVDDEDFEKLNQHKWFFNNGYAGRMFGALLHRKAIAMHREIMNAPDGMDVDHISHDTLDNRRINLRVCTRSQNQGNRIAGKNSSSGLKGVTFESRPKAHLSPWKAHIAGRTIGYFRTYEEAARAYDEAAKEKFGEFAKTNYE